MAIRIVEGVPGAGKTFYVVWHLLTNYFRWCEKLDWWVQKDKNLRVFSNIDGFKLGESLETAMEKAGGPNKFFTVPYLKGLLGEVRAVFIIDEAQRYFDRRFFDKSVFYLFQYHRHLGVDFYLVTQDVETLAKELRNLCEYRIEAVRRSLSLLGEFRYRFVQGSDFKAECFQTKTLRRDPRVFAVYKSMSAEEIEQVKSSPRRMLVWLVLLVVLICGGVWQFQRGVFGKRAKGGLTRAVAAEMPKNTSGAGEVKNSAPVGEVKTGLDVRREGVSSERFRGRSETVGAEKGAAVAVGVGAGGPGLAPVGGGVGADRSGFLPGWRRVGWGKLVAEFKDEADSRYLVETHGFQHVASASEVATIFRRPASGLTFGIPYAVWVHVQTADEEREETERATMQQQAAPARGLPAQSAAPTIAGLGGGGGAPTSQGQAGGPRAPQDASGPEAVATR